MKASSPKGCNMCPPFWVVGRESAYHFQESISERLHNHSFVNILFYLLFDSHQMHLRSCARPCVGAWLLTHPIILFFRLLLNVFFIVVSTRLGFFHLLVLEVLHCIVINLWILWGSTFFIAHMVGRGQPCMMLCEIFWWSLRKMHDFICCENKPMSFCPLPYNFCVVKLTLCY